MVRVITQDELGYMWFGTNTGLVRFDGYTLKTYQGDTDRSNAVDGSFIRALEVDDNNVLWIGGGSGLSRYNRDTDDFTVYLPDESNPDSLVSNYITSIAKGNDGFLWVATDQGLDLFDTKKGIFKHFRHNPDDEASLTDNNVRQLMKAANGDLWIGTVKGLVHYSQKTNTFKRIQLAEEEKARVISIAESQSGIIWVSNYEGLFKYDPSNQSIEKTPLEKGAYWVNSILVDADDNLWFSYVDQGLSRLDKNGEILNFMPDKGDASSLNANTVMDMYVDRSGIMWLGSFRGGLSYFNPDSLSFGSHNISANSLSCLNAMRFSSALALDANRMLLGSFTAGLTEVDLKEKSCTNYQFDADSKSSISSNWVSRVLKDRDGNIWVATNQGLDKFDRKSGQFENISRQNNDEQITLLFEKDDYLILAGLGPLRKLNLVTREISVIPAVDDVLKTTTYHALAIGKDGTIWGATQNGLVTIDSQLKEVRQVINKEQPLLQQRMTALVIDKENMIWLGIDEMGLFHFDSQAQTLNELNETLNIPVKEGLSGLYLGGNDNLWLTTLGLGLFKIDNSLDKAVQYRMTDGLNGDEIPESSFARLPDGRLFFGGPEGFNLFNPLEVKTNQTAPIVSLTQLKRFGKTVVPGQDYDGFSLDNHISKTQTLSFSHRDSVFGLEFVAIHFSDPDKIKYSYRLKGFDDNWTETNAQNRGVTYNNLDPGEYTFQLKAQTDKGVWSKNDVALKITILPAPWLTWWAFAIYITTLILSVLIFVKKRTQNLEKQAQTLKEVVEQRTHELVVEKNKVEQLLSRKQEEFANISHEFRTPLALILGPAQQMESLSLSNDIKSKVEVIKRNAYRMLRMVDQLLHLETFRVKTITQKTVQDFQTIIQLIAESFEDLAKRQNIELTIKQIDQVYFEFTPDALEKILLNLLSNAVKYTESGETISISAIRNQKQQLVITVKDSGIGIPEDKLASIFDRFNRVLNEHSERVTGAGIGLALVKELVEAHDGWITVDSTLGQGTTISVYLPIVGEVLSLDEAYHANEETIELELMGAASPSLVDSQIEVSTITAQSDCPSILVIEDNPDMQSYIVESLSTRFNCITASDGEEGVMLAQQWVPDIIISDVMMPKMDGYQVTHSLRVDVKTSHIPIILLTALGDRESRLKGWQEKADEYLTKPFDVEELHIRVQNLLDIRELVRNRRNTALFQNSKKPLKQLASQKLSTDTEPKIESSIQQIEKEEEFLEELDRALESLYQDSELKIEMIADILFMSQRQLLRKLKGILDMTPLEYLRRYRLDKSRRLLAEGNPASRVAFDVGFSTHSHFGKSFKSLYGCTPSEYQTSDLSN